MAVSLTPEWIEHFRAELEPRLNRVQKLAAKAIWDWFDELWRDEQGIRHDPFEDLQQQSSVFFEALERADSRDEIDNALVDLVDFLRGINGSVFHPH